MRKIQIEQLERNEEGRKEKKKGGREEREAEVARGNITKNQRVFLKSNGRQSKGQDTKLNNYAKRKPKRINPKNCNISKRQQEALERKTFKNCVLYQLSNTGTRKRVYLKFSGYSPSI